MIYPPGTEQMVEQDGKYSKTVSVKEIYDNCANAGKSRFERERYSYLI